LGSVSFAQFSTGFVRLYHIDGGHRGCSADGDNVCAHHSGARPVLTAPHSLERRGDATNALSLLARARTTKPRDARARNSLIAICAADGPRSAGIGRGPRTGPGPTGALFSERRYRIHYGVTAAFCV
jgi:hypothetical protein